MKHWVIFIFLICLFANKMSEHDRALGAQRFEAKYADTLEFLNNLDSGKQYLIRIHLGLSPYDTMDFDKSIIAIARHCSIDTSILENKLNKNVKLGL